jgi:multidrug efflux system membrane fusion protein
MRTSSAAQPRMGAFRAFWPCFPWHRLLAPEPPPEPVRAVKLLTVGVSELQSVQEEYAGEVRARVESRLGFRVAGKIVQRQAELGQRVQAGQVLAQLDPQDYQLAPGSARAGGRGANAARSGGGRLPALRQALKDQNFISGAELERRESALKAAQATLAAGPGAGPQGQPGAVHAAGGRRFAGVVTGIDAEPGQVVAAGTPVVRLAHDGARDVVFAVPEDKVTRLAPGQAGPVRTWSTGGRLPLAPVREVAASADPATRTFPSRWPSTRPLRRRWAPRCMWCPGAEAKGHRPSSCPPRRCARRARPRRCGCTTRPPARCARRWCRWPRPMATMPWWPRPHAGHAGGGHRGACALAGAER